MRISDWSSDVCSSDLDFSSKIETKTRGRTRLERFETLVQQLEELVEKDRANKAVLLSQVLRIEIKLMGHSLTDRSQWIIPNPNRPTNEDAIYTDRKSTRLNSSH